VHADALHRRQQRRQEQQEQEGEKAGSPQQEVVLALGIWIGVLAARALASIQASEAAAAADAQSTTLRVCVIEGSPSARQLASAVIEAQQPPKSEEGSHGSGGGGGGGRGGLSIELVSVDWGRFDPSVHLQGRPIAAVLAEPWFR
jgi:hypothetical protein